MELAAKLLHSFDFLPNYALHVKTFPCFDQYLLTMFSQTLPTAHWTQLESPAEVNAIIRKWLTELDAKQGHTRDEL
jgi:pimeloyl-ACP methyl ester carboxylesterase